jgi:proteasome lid subunit RPN8/RPN11
VTAGLLARDIVLANAAPLHRMMDAAAAAGRAECCGVLFGQDAAVEAAAALPNEAADPRATFAIGAPALAAAARAHRPLDVIGFFHSHPNDSLVPSRSDLAHAAGWPGYLHAIVATNGTVPTGLAFFRVAASSWDALHLEVRGAWSPF